MDYKDKLSDTIDIVINSYKELQCCYKQLQIQNAKIESLERHIKKLDDMLYKISMRSTEGE